MGWSSLLTYGQGNDPTWPVFDPDVAIPVESVRWGRCLMLIGLCYLAGSIPFGVLVGYCKGKDVRREGSGNIGATNVARLLGRGYGLFVFGLDFLKGFVPIWLVAHAHHPYMTWIWLLNESAMSQSNTLRDPMLWKQYQPFVQFDLPVICAGAAVLGHTFPIWLRFRGGKGGATGLGVGAVLSPWAMLAAAAVWVIVRQTTRYVSLATILGSVAYVVAVIVLALPLADMRPRESGWIAPRPVDREHRSLLIFSAAMSALVTLRHKSNIQRLRAGTEPRLADDSH